MFKKKYKIDKKDIEELKARQKILNQYLCVADAINFHIKLYTNSILKKHGLDMNKSYNINLDKGYAVEQEQHSQQQPQQKQQ